MAQRDLRPTAEPSDVNAPTGWDEGVTAPPSIPDGAAAPPTMLSTAEIAAAFGRSPRSMRRWVERGYLVPVRIGGAVFFRVEDVRRLISDRMVETILKQKAARSIRVQNTFPAEYKAL